MHGHVSLRWVTLGSFLVGLHLVGEELGVGFHVHVDALLKLLDLLVVLGDVLAIDQFTEKAVGGIRIL